MPPGTCDQGAETFLIFLYFCKIISINQKVIHSYKKPINKKQMALDNSTLTTAKITVAKPTASVIDVLSTLTTDVPIASNWLSLAL